LEWAGLRPRPFCFVTIGARVLDFLRLEFPGGMQIARLGCPDGELHAPPP
jgi:hypothetical protein